MADVELQSYTNAEYTAQDDEYQGNDSDFESNVDYKQKSASTPNTHNYGLDPSTTKTAGTILGLGVGVFIGIVAAIFCICVVLPFTIIVIGGIITAIVVSTAVESASDDNNNNNN